MTPKKRLNGGGSGIYYCHLPALLHRMVVCGLPLALHSVGSKPPCSRHGGRKVGFLSHSLAGHSPAQGVPTGPGNYALFLEDDVVVSEYLFEYGERMILAYKDSPDSILGLKLYNQRWDEINMQAAVRIVPKALNKQKIIVAHF
jgi:hypothetical protein